MSNLGPVNILLVDDRPEGLFTLETVLKRPEYNLVKAESGEQALRRLLDEDFALVLMDVQMPGMDGFETAHLIRERKKSRHVPIIFVTAINKEESFVGKGYEAGAVDYIFKPFNPDILRSKVAVFVDLFNTKRQIQAQALLLREQERKEQERQLLQTRLENMQRYENLANSIPHMVWKAKNIGEMDYFNRVWLDFTGQSHEQSVTGAWTEAIHPEDRPKLTDAWNKAVSENKNQFELECRIKSDSSGKHEWFWMKALAERDLEGNIISWIGTNTDIKVKKELEKQKASFLSIASHELKTPLTAVKTSLEAADFIFNSGKLDETGIKHIRNFMNIGVESIDRMDELLEEFLDFSRVEAARMSIKPKRCCLSEVVEKAVESHMPRIVKTNRLKLNSRIEKKIYATFDSPRMRQVVDNLLSNAIKYSPEKGVIDVKVESKNGQALISVQDQGIGMKSTDLNKIFKPFKRVSSSSAVSGLGIGLYISSWIVEEHMGKIEVQSEKGKGSTFTVRLPLGGEI